MTRKLIPLLVVAVLALAAPAAQAYLPPGFVGISPQTSANSADFELMREGGVDSVRLPLYWSQIQERSPLVSDPDWNAFDREVELAAEDHMQVMPFVFSSPAWVAPESIDLPVRSSWQRWAWMSFLREAAHRYGVRGMFWKERPDLPYLPIRMWEIWNEENIVSFARRPSPGRFAVLVRMSGRVLHRADPGAKVILGGLFGRPLQIPPNVGSGEFLSRLYRAHDVKRYFDGIALHPYVADARAMAAQLANLRRISRVHRDGRTPLYVTELGWGSRSGPTRWERGLYGQARELSEAFRILSRERLRLRIDGAWWFTWADAQGGCEFCRTAGLLTEKRRAKPSWYRFNAWTGGDPGAVPRAHFGE